MAKIVLAHQMDSITLGCALHPEPTGVKGRVREKRFSSVDLTYLSPVKTNVNQKISFCVFYPIIQVDIFFKLTSQNITWDMNLICS